MFNINEKYHKKVNNGIRLQKVVYDIIFVVFTFIKSAFSLEDIGEEIETYILNNLCNN